jgi:8-oxo-dGTP pyrophosphatase MutT (NUDIX family)
MKRTEVVAAAIRNENTFFMQRRNGLNQKGAIGLLGFWGGKIEKGETIKEAGVRELGEETTLSLKPYELGYDHRRNRLEIPESYKWLGFIDRKSLLIAHVVNLRVIETPQFTAKEGTLEMLDKPGVIKAMDHGQLSPVAEMYFKRNPYELIDN